MRTLIAGCALAASLLSAQVPPASPSAAPRTLVLSDVDVINPAENGAVRTHVDVVIRDRKIAAVRRHGSAPAEPGEERIDLAGAFALPGFVDMHAHALLSPRDPGDGHILPRPSEATTREMLRLMLSYGVTTIRDPGDPTEAVVALRNAIAEGRIEGPTMFVAGRILNTTAPGPEFVRVTSEDEVCDEIQRQAKAGVDFIKVYSGLRPSLVGAAIRCARDHHLRVIGHLGATTWTEAAEMGIGAIAHGAPWSASYLSARDRATYDGSLFGRVQWLRDVNLESVGIVTMARTMAKRHVTVDPTLIAGHTKFWGDDPRYIAAKELAQVPEEYRAGWPRGSFTADWTAEMYGDAREEWPKQLDLVELLFKSGVLLTVGTDTPTPWIVPGLSVHQEMQLLRDAGLSPIEILKCATSNAAIALHQRGRIGTIAAGARADIVVLDRNPLHNLAYTRAIRMVVKDGSLIRRTP